MPGLRWDTVAGGPGAVGTFAAAVGGARTGCPTWEASRAQSSRLSRCSWWAGRTRDSEACDIFPSAVSSLTGLGTVPCPHRWRA